MLLSEMGVWRGGGDCWRGTCWRGICWRGICWGVVGFLSGGCCFGRRVDGGGGAVYFARWRRVVKGGGGGVLFCQGFDGVADSKNWRIEGVEINGDRVGGSVGREGGS